MGNEHTYKAYDLWGISAKQAHLIEENRTKH